MTPERQREKLAVHESGHACIRVALGGEVRYASIVEDYPHVRVKTVLSEKDEHVAVVAGIVAEFVFYPEASKVGHYGGDDLERVGQWPKADQQEAFARARELVRTHRSAIGRVADELLASTIILGEQIQQAVKETTQQ
jgi:ATP-dependent Zn protease